MPSNYKRLGDYIREVRVKNTDLKATLLLGINIDKFFMPSVANVVGTDMANYRIVNKNQFACNRMHVGRDYRIPIALSNRDEPFMVSPAYDVFEIIDPSFLLPEYLMMWFSRKEFDRNAWFHTDADVRGGLPWKLFCDLKLPIPSPEKQLEIVREYNVIQNRIKLNNQLITKLEETAQAIYKQWFVDFEFPDENGLPYKSNGGEMVESELGAIPKGWEVNKLSFYTSYIGRGITPKYCDNGEIIVINQKCIRRNSLELTFSRYHNISLKKVSDEKILKEWDILVNSTGTGTLGRVALVKAADDKMTVDTHVTIVRASQDVDALYLWFNLSSRTSEIELLAEGSTGQTELSRDNLGGMNIILPDKKIQLEFCDLMQKIVRIAHLYEKEYAILKLLNKSLFLKITKVEIEKEFA